MDVPEGYYHKATSESYNSAEKVEVYRNDLWDDYLVVINDAEPGLHCTKTQLELLILAASDVLHDEKV